MAQDLQLDQNTGSYMYTTSTFPHPGYDPLLSGSLPFGIPASASVVSNTGTQYWAVINTNENVIKILSVPFSPTSQPSLGPTFEVPQPHSIVSDDSSIPKVYLTLAGPDSSVLILFWVEKGSLGTPDQLYSISIPTDTTLWGDLSSSISIVSLSSFGSSASLDPVITASGSDIYIPASNLGSVLPCVLHLAVSSNSPYVSVGSCRPVGFGLNAFVGTLRVSLADVDGNALLIAIDKHGFVAPFKLLPVALGYPSISLESGTVELHVVKLDGGNGDNGVSSVIAVDRGAESALSLYQLSGLKDWTKVWTATDTVLSSTSLVLASDHVKGWVYLCVGMNAADGRGKVGKLAAVGINDGSLVLAPGDASCSQNSLLLTDDGDLVATSISDGKLTLYRSPVVVDNGKVNTRDGNGPLNEEWSVNSASADFANALTPVAVAKAGADEGVVLFGGVGISFGAVITPSATSTTDQPPTPTASTDTPTDTTPVTPPPFTSSSSKSTSLSSSSSRSSISSSESMTVPSPTPPKPTSTVPSTTGTPTGGAEGSGGNASNNAVAISLGTLATLFVAVLIGIFVWRSRKGAAGGRASGAGKLAEPVRSVGGGAPPSGSAPATSVDSLRRPVNAARGNYAVSRSSPPTLPDVPRLQNIDHPSNFVQYGNHPTSNMSNGNLQQMNTSAGPISRSTAVAAAVAGGVMVASSHGRERTPATPSNYNARYVNQSQHQHSMDINDVGYSPAVVTAAYEVAETEDLPMEDDDDMSTTVGAYAPPLPAPADRRFSIATQGSTSTVRGPTAAPMMPPLPSPALTTPRLDTVQESSETAEVSSLSRHVPATVEASVGAVASTGSGVGGNVGVWSYGGEPVSRRDPRGESPAGGSSVHTFEETMTTVSTNSFPSTPPREAPSAVVGYVPDVDSQQQQQQQRPQQFASSVHSAAVIQAATVMPPLPPGVVPTPKPTPVANSYTPIKPVVAVPTVPVQSAPSTSLPLPPSAPMRQVTPEAPTPTPTSTSAFRTTSPETTGNLHHTTEQQQPIQHVSPPLAKSPTPSDGPSLSRSSSFQNQNQRQNLPIALSPTPSDAPSTLSRSSSFQSHNRDSLMSSNDDPYGSLRRADSVASSGYAASVSSDNTTRPARTSNDGDDATIPRSRGNRIRDSISNDSVSDGFEYSDDDDAAIDAAVVAVA
ncbi:hypothetical protein HDU76_013405, partial [Blyttiomyces sp. JEL0837]